MNRQLNGCGETFSAQVAPMRPLPRVSACMHQQGPRATKGHTTCAAQVRLLFVMCPLVHSARVQLCECLVAKLAGIWALSGVKTHVGRQDWLRQEPLVTVRAGVRPLSAVMTHVDCEQSLRIKSLPTNAASEGQDFRVKVITQMLFQVFVVFIGLIALSALEWPCRRVNKIMFFQRRMTCKSLATLQAGVFTGA